MTTSTDTPISMEDVRDRFVKAESTLNELTESLMSLRSAAERFDAGNSGLRGASERLLSLSDRLAAVTQSLSGSIELMGQAIGVLERSEPARVLTALDHLEKVVESVANVLRTNAEGMTREVQGVGAILNKLESSADAAESRDVAHLNALQEALSNAAETQASRIGDATAAIQRLSKTLAEHRAEFGQMRSEAAAGRRQTLLVISGIGAVIVVLQLVQLLR